MSDFGLTGLEEAAGLANKDIPEGMGKIKKGFEEAKASSLGLLEVIGQIASSVIAMPQDMSPFSETSGIIEEWGGLQEGIGSVLLAIGENILKTFNLDETLGTATTALQNFSQAVLSCGLSEAFSQMINRRP